MKEIKVTLFDQDPNQKTKVQATVTFNNGSIVIKPEGYEVANGGEPILIEVWEGKLRVVVWSDINKEDPTHIISLEGAKESALVNNFDQETT